MLPAPAVIIETEKLSLANDEKVSFVPAVIVASPFEDNVAVKCLLTLKLVSVRPEFAVVFNVLAVLYGNLNNEILFSGFCNFALCFVTIPAVVTSEPPTLAVNSNELFESIYLTVPVTVPPALLLNVI